MNFIEAVKEMKEGKKVRRKSTGNKENYIEIGKGNTWISCPMFVDEEPIINLNEIEATDWMVVKEEKKIPLSGYIHPEDHTIHAQQIKEELKEFIEWIFKESYGLKNKHIDSSLVNKKAKEIFGEELI